MHDAVEQFGHFVARALGIQSDAGEWWLGQITEEFVVIDAQHGHLLWDLQLGHPTAIEHHASVFVVAGQNADGGRQVAEPI